MEHGATLRHKNACKLQAIALLNGLTIAPTSAWMSALKEWIPMLIQPLSFACHYAPTHQIYTSRITPHECVFKLVLREYRNMAPSETIKLEHVRKLAAHSATELSLPTPTLKQSIATVFLNAHNIQLNHFLIPRLELACPSAQLLLIFTVKLLPSPALANAPMELMPIQSLECACRDAQTASSSLQAPPTNV